MICPSCGNEVREGAEFCPLCGAAVANTRNTIGQANTDAASSVFAEQERKAKKKAVKKVFLLIIAVIVIVGVVLVIWGAKQSQSASNNSAAPAATESSTSSADSATSSSSASSPSAVSARDFIGSWKCEDWDAVDSNNKMVIYTDYLSFENDGYFLETVRRASDNSSYAYASTYRLTNGKVNLKSGNWITLGEDETLIYHFAEANKGGRSKSEYVFKKIDAGTYTSTGLLAALGSTDSYNEKVTWYGQNVNASITFKRDGTYEYSDGTKGAWDVYNDSVIAVHGTDKDGNEATFEFAFNDQMTELTNGDHIFKLTKPKS